MTCIRIDVADNGFVLEYDDPEVRALNRGDGPWQDPSRSRVYSTVEALAADLKTVLPLFKTQDEEMDKAAVYKTALNEAFAKGTN
jgi:hypothetical protein